MEWDLAKLNDNQLAMFYNDCVLCDKVNINTRLTGLGFTKEVASKILSSISSNSKSSSICILNDFGFQLTKALLDEGFTNIKLVFGQWKEVKTPKLNKKGLSTRQTISSYKLDDTILYNIYRMLPVWKATKGIELIRAEELF